MADVSHNWALRFINDMGDAILAATLQVETSLIAKIHYFILADNFPPR